MSLSFNIGPPSASDDLHVQPLSQRIVRPTKVPAALDWAGYEKDLDAEYAYRLFFGRDCQDVLREFGGGASIERAEDLHFMPRRAFQYYVLAFAQFVTSDAAQSDPDSASPFLRLLIAREESDPGSVAQIYAELRPSIEFVASHQERYGADLDIYGDFKELARKIAEVCEAPHARG